MQTKSISANSVAELKVQLNELINESFQPNLAIIFASIKHDLSSLSKIFDEKNIDLFGLSSAGEIVDKEVMEFGIVGLILEVNPDFYRVKMVDNSFDSLFETGKVAGDFSKKAFENPALMVGSGGLTVDVEQVVYGLKSVLGGSVPMFGGLAGDDWTLEQTYAFTRKKVTDNGIITLTFDSDKIEMQGLAVCGWEAIGKTNVITKADGNVVYSINDEPALDVFLRYFGYLESNEVNTEKLDNASAQYPMQVFRKDGTSVLRSPMKSNLEDKSILMAGNVSEGAEFRFSVAPGFQVIDQTIDEFGALKKDFPEADALILFSCKGRHASLGPMIEDEVEGIFDYWSKPMIGFFSYGEIGNVKGGTCDFHNETCSLVLLKEK
jgi:hypothetical protein